MHVSLNMHCHFLTQSVIIHSFPGGMSESGDADIIETALRETKEELGLIVDRGQVWGTMQAVPSRVNNVSF